MGEKVFEIYKEFIIAGFDHNQAFELTKIELFSGILSGSKSDETSAVNHPIIPNNLYQF